jgi:hypothetical protein
VGRGRRPAQGGRGLIVVGKILDQLGAVARSRAVPDRSPTGVGFRVKTDYSCEPLELRSRQPRDLPVNVGHDWSRLIGTVRHLEVGAHPGEVWAVADIRDGQLPEEPELYFSIEGRSGGRDGAVLSALAVTPRPAGVGLSPLRLFPGDVRGLPETETLRLRTTEPFLARLLERARAATKRRRYGAPPVVENRSAPAPPVEEYDGPVGPIERSPWVGRVISVR